MYLATTKRTREVTSGKRRSDSIHDILNNITTDDEDDLTETDSPELSALSTSPGMQSNLPGGRNASRRSKAKLPGAPRKRLSVWYVLLNVSYLYTIHSTLSYH
jgi:hypothetical protein